MKRKTLENVLEPSEQMMLVDTNYSCQTFAMKALSRSYYC